MSVTSTLYVISYLCFRSPIRKENLFVHDDRSFLFRIVIFDENFVLEETKLFLKSQILMRVKIGINSTD